MKLFILYILMFFFCAAGSHAQKRDFGATGLKGLSPSQLANLSKGDIVFLKSEATKAGGKNEMTEAAILFLSSPEITWKLISKTDDQPNYIDGCLEVKVIRKTTGKAYEVHKVGNRLVTYSYGVIQNYLPESRCIYWTLDTSFTKNDLKALSGYWQFYPYGNGQTLARYGSRISFKNIPSFLENSFKKDGVKDALTSVKKYVDSGGTYHK